MRYKIRTANDTAYESALSAAHRLEAQIRVQLPARRLLSVEDPSDALLAEVTSLGATVSVDSQQERE